VLGLKLARAAIGADLRQDMVTGTRGQNAATRCLERGQNYLYSSDATTRANNGRGLSSAFQASQRLSSVALKQTSGTLKLVETIMERETIAVIINDKPVIIALADAVAEWFRIMATVTERALTNDERKVKAALVQALGSLNTGDEAQKLYDALK
jgi:hypothetical protein